MRVRLGSRQKKTIENFLYGKRQFQDEFIDRCTKPRNIRKKTQQRALWSIKKIQYTRIYKMKSPRVTRKCMES